MSDLNASLEAHRKAALESTDLKELYSVAEAALEMLAIIRQHQLDRVAETA
ncbi:MAG: hypothetical protein AAFQ22_08005 [Pseudomonadota bacterium]